MRALFFLCFFIILVFSLAFFLQPVKNLSEFHSSSKSSFLAVLYAKENIFSFYKNNCIQSEVCGVYSYASQLH